MTNVYLKPAKIENADGDTVLAKVRDPDTFIPLASDGEWKPMSPFWLRRIRDGDVIKAVPQSEKRAKLPAVAIAD